MASYSCKIFQYALEFSHNASVTDRRTDRRTDGRTNNNHANGSTVT